MSHEACGQHAVLDGVADDPALLSEGPALLRLLLEAAAIVGATVLHAHVERFAPQGVTAIIVLAESHATVHTYPEAGAYFVDFFTCGRVDPRPAIEFIAGALGGAGRKAVIGRSSPT